MSLYDTALSIGGIYLFIALGYMGKRHFGDRLDQKSLVLVSIYLLQPMLIFWGLTGSRIDGSAAEAALYFLLLSLLLLGISWAMAGVLFEDMKERSVATVASVVGNTGNLGIPLGIALFGEGSILYTSLINLVNVFIVYTVGVYFYSRGENSVADSFRNIFRLPAIWFGIFAITFNLSGAEVPHALKMPLGMGAYATMVLQLMIFGIYLATVKSHEIPARLFAFIGLFKFIFIPLFLYLLFGFISTDRMLFDTLMLEMIVPMAVMNVNLAALYDSLPSQVAFLTFATSVIFLVYLFAMMKWIFI
jgi:predicted permease